MKEHFVDRKFSPESLQVVTWCNEILEEYETEGYDVSLRQLYYQLVARDLVVNTEKSYTRVGGIVSDARLAGLIDWDMIKDRGRECVENSHWTSSGQFLRSVADQYDVDTWEGQDTHVEVMVEKQALEGVLLPVCQRLDVAFTANKGYSSSSSMYEAGKRLERIWCFKHRIVILYLGDHDPSGIDMTRDVQDRLQMFAGEEVPIEVQRVALNMDQIRVLNPPENPAKMSDSRARDYVKRFGTSSWELDAIEPRALDKLVSDAILEHRDEDIYNATIERRDAERDRLIKLAKGWK